MIDYGFIKEVDKGFEQAVDEVTKALEKAGFGVLTTINVKEKFKHYQNARQAIEAEENIGLMLPCNVIVYEKNGRVIIAAIKPTAAMQMIDNPQLGTIAAEVEAQLKRVIDSLQ